MGIRAHHCPGRLRRPSRPRARRRRARVADLRAHRDRPGHPARFLQAILGDLQHARLVTSQRGRDGGYRLALPPSEISIARVMRVEQGFLAEVHGQRPEDVDYPGAAAALATVWVAAREAYRRVLEEVTLADVVAGKLPAARRRSWSSWTAPGAPSAS